MGRGREEGHLLTAIVPSSQARLAVVADQARLNGNPIAGLEVSDRGMGCENDSGRLVAEDVVVCHDHGPNRTMPPEVDVRSGF